MGVIRKERPTRGLGTDRDIFFILWLTGKECNLMHESQFVYLSSGD